jgi:hypothetical protein
MVLTVTLGDLHPDHVDLLVQGELGNLVCHTDPGRLISIFIGNGDRQYWKLPEGLGDDLAVGTVDVLLVSRRVDG